jgi:hypothetical protein
MSTAGDSIVVQCPACQKRFKGSAKLTGKTVKCSACGGAIKVPGLGGATAPAAPRTAAAVKTPATAAVAATPRSNAPDWPPADEPGDFEAALAAAANEASTAPSAEAQSFGVAPAPYAPGVYPPPGFPPPHPQTPNGMPPPGMLPPGMVPGAYPPVGFAPQAYPPHPNSIPIPGAPGVAGAPKNRRMLLIVGGGVVLVGLVATAIVIFTSTRWKLAGTWEMSKPGNRGFPSITITQTFSYTGQYTATLSTSAVPNFAAREQTVTGTWELEGDDQVAIKVDSQSFPLVDRQGSRAPDTGDYTFDFKDSDTLKMRRLRDSMTLTFKRK